jgi:hypothetical protein
MTDFVRVQTENGLHGTVPRAHAEAHGMKILHDHEALDSSGAPLGQSDPNASEPDAAASPYEDRNVAQLRSLIDARNEGRDDASRISKAGSKADLVAALTAADLTT